ncbi:MULTISPECIES: MFS transporter [Pseudomonas syringae group genomosp. 2]|uniref:Major facilitator transporter n=3 Tax=Pseudomonas syringae group genomosp. 2 TaxID=251698 RepID=A0A3M5BHQ9_PSESS|nr:MULTISPECIES: MFS transporter [Pseudomonas syringae group genomosp. 2]KPW59400.1 Major facilitator transporter [Pseudomonas syringae pv. broussonetiae]KPX93646.1 Major facilitator transporter [Pseudomonas amygdali pv. mori]KWT04785.1 MFS transporter [Pseudomonas syringae pv. broussonetiae]RMQ38665.1 Major facilitator transporter [Pseudomonas amygdali pv. mori]RMR43023.1 Major facilitator transporter [Pseudomonas amygdali pv. mori]
MTTRDNALVTPRIRRARIATFAGFMMVGAMMYIWSTGVTAFREQLGLSGDAGDVDFGIIAFGIGVGSAAGSFLIGKFLDVFGSKKVIYVTAVGYPLSIIPLGFATGFHFALGCGIVLGLLRGAIDTAFNTHGVQVERFYRRPIMSAFHAFYSLGGFLLGMIGSAFAEHFTNSAQVPFSVLGGAMLVIGLVVGHFMLDKHDVAPEFSEESAPVQQPSSSTGTQAKAIILLMIGFGVLLLGSMVGESAIADWGQEYIRRVLETPVSTAGMAVSVFIGAECFGRLIGDRLAEKIGASKVVLLSAVLAIGGLIITVVGHSVVYGVIGFALFGLGLSCIAPLMLSSAGRKDPLNAGRNIGIVNCIGYSGMLLGPAAIATVVNFFGIERLLFFPMVLLVPLALFGPVLMRNHLKSDSQAKAAKASIPNPNR